MFNRHCSTQPPPPTRIVTTPVKGVTRIRRGAGHVSCMPINGRCIQSQIRLYTYNYYYMYAYRAKTLVVVYGVWCIFYYRNCSNKVVYYNIGHFKSQRFTNDFNYEIWSWEDGDWSNIYNYCFVYVSNSVLDYRRKKMLTSIVKLLHFNRAYACKNYRR